MDAGRLTPMSKIYCAGDTNELAIVFSIESDPDRGDHALPDLAASWGTIQLWVQGRNLFEHRDRARGLHDRVRWYLRPILVWLGSIDRVLVEDIVAPFATQVDRGVDFVDYELVQRHRTEEQLARAEASLDAWRRRHALSSARAGGAFPEVVFRRVDDEVEVSWSERLAPSRAGCSFVDREGSTSLPLASVRQTLRELRAHAQTVLGAPDHEFDPPPFESLLDRVRAVSRNHDVLAVRSDNSLGAVGRLAQTLEPEIVTDDLQTIVEAADVPVSTRLQPPLSVERSDPPYERGYAAAQQVRDRLGLGGETIGPIEELLDRLGVRYSCARLRSTAARSIATDDEAHDVGGAVLCNAASTWQQRPPILRASAATALGHIVLGRARRAAVGAAFGTRRLRADASREAGAFAAMLLIPERRIEQLDASPSAVFDLARELGVSPTMLVAHATNRGFISEEARDQLAEELGLTFSGN